MKQIALDMGLTPEPTLNSFLPGPNAAAHEHVRMWARGATRAPVPTYLWGDSGSGKTHLLRASAHALTSGGAAVGWLTPQDTEPAEFNPAWVAVMLDDVQRFNAVQQRAAFKWFVDAQTHQRWVLASGTLPVADLPLREDLRTRLGWGHVFALHTLDDAQRRAVLRQEADARGLFLKDEVIDFILSRFSRDLSSLVGLIERLDQFALQEKRAVTVPLVKTMLEEM
jgi:DnaA-homolog protein